MTRLGNLLPPLAGPQDEPVNGWGAKRVAMTEHKKSTTQVAGTTDVRTRESTLSPLEEKVVRMAHGLPAPNDLILEHMGQGNPELTAKLAAMEKRLLATVGARSNDTKRKIVNTLRRKQRPETR